MTEQINTPKYQNTAAFFAQYNIDINSENAAEQINNLINEKPSIAITIASTLGAAVINQLVAMPDLEEPDTENTEEDLDKLIALLQMETDEKQIKQAKERIEAQKSKMDQTYKEQLKKIEDNIEKAKKAEKNSVIGRIFSWIGAAISVAVAAVACIASGGLAVGAVAGALIALTTLALNETGTMEKITKNLAEALQKAFGGSKMASQIAAQILIMLLTVVASAACSLGSAVTLGGKAAETAAKAADAITKAAKSAQMIQTIKNAITAASLSLGLAQIGVGISSTVTNYKAQMGEAEEKEIEKLLAMLQQTIDEEKEDLQAIMNALQNCISGILAILESENSAKNTIEQQIGNMA